MAKKTITITLYMSEMIYDVQNKTYLTGKSRDNGNNHEEVANMQNNDDDEHKNQVLRSLGNAFGTLKTKLSEFFEENGTTSTNKLLPETNITISLKMPSNYNQSTVDTISSALHQYMVNSAISDWFNITNKNDASEYLAQSTANLEQVREAINKRVRPVRTNV